MQRLSFGGEARVKAAWQRVEALTWLTSLASLLPPPSARIPTWTNRLRFGVAESGKHAMATTDQERQPPYNTYYTS
eukprot:scaffold4986_cov139-Skeletonema_dohrnii-CCMP3373.AAC.4